MKSAQRKEQPEKSATRKGCKMRKVNHEKSKSETRKSAARKMCNMSKVQRQSKIWEKVQKKSAYSAQTANELPVNGLLNRLSTRLR